MGSADRCHQLRRQMSSAPQMDVISSADKCHQLRRWMSSAPQMDVISSADKCHQLRRASVGLKLLHTEFYTHRGGCEEHRGSHPTKGPWPWARQSNGNVTVMQRPCQSHRFGCVPFGHPGTFSSSAAQCVTSTRSSTTCCRFRTRETQ